MMSGQPVSDRVRIRRNPVRGVYDRAAIDAVLDSDLICHVAWVESAEPRMIPTLYFREEDFIYLHGNRQSAALRAIGAGGLACVTVTRVDGVVVARSGFHCSMNYRSVTLFGAGRAVEGDEGRRRLDQFVERLIPGHLDRVREPTPQEIAATVVIAIPVSEASAKIRTGDSIDAEDDLDADVWAGVIPLSPAVGQPRPNADLKAGIGVPPYVASWQYPDARHD